MKYKLLFISTILMLCAGYGLAQQQTATVPNRALTYMERKMYTNADLSGLAVLYDSLKTEYDRRYFLSALPGFFAERKIQASVIPTWINAAVIAGLRSMDPLCIFNAANTANILKIGCAQELMAVYTTVHNTFGSHEDMIKTAILGALAGLNDPSKQSFLLSVLANDYFPLLSASFSALLNAIETVKTPTFLPKITEYSDSLNSLATRMQSAKEKSSKLPECLAMQNRVNNLRKELGGK
jgi:hypothetical protein